MSAHLKKTTQDVYSLDIVKKPLNFLEEGDNKVDYEAILKEVIREVEHRRVQVTDLYFDLNSSNPATQLPLTDYQKGLLNGRISAFESICILITELKLKDENIETFEKKS